LLPSAALLALLAPTAGRYQKASEQFTHARRKDTVTLDLTMAYNNLGAESPT